MPETPVALRVPRACVMCGREGSVRLQQTLHGEQALLQWHCSACGHEWLVRRKDQEPAPRNGHAA